MDPSGWIRTSWSSDGRYLVFSADPDGITNIFVLDRAADRLYQLTNVPFGAMEPSLSPDGATLAFVEYRHEQYQLDRRRGGAGNAWIDRGGQAHLEGPHRASHEARRASRSRARTGPSRGEAPSLGSYFP